MSELQSVLQLLAQAKRAADEGKLGSANELLLDAARIQEAELGPLHPELANTVNNLAVVAEMEGRLGDAETYYRRAVAIASASLPPDDPMAASSRKNLEDFCRERGLPFDRPVATPSVQLPEQGSDEGSPDRTSVGPKLPPDIEVAPVDTTQQTSTPAFGEPSGARSTGEADRRPAAAAGRTARSPMIIGIVLVALVTAVLLVMRPWSTRESPGRVRTPDAAVPPAAEPAPPPSAVPQPPASASTDKKSGATGGTAPTRSSGDLTLVTAQLCRNLTVGSSWRCDPAGQSVAPGPLAMYTRVKSPRNAVVIHRWYRGDTLRKSSRLTIVANATDGYRTYSRQTVKSGEDWRVEVTNIAGDVLYEQRVSVR
jgi:hypothetical protein